jgi:hypothetical protein
MFLSDQFRFSGSNWIYGCGKYALFAAGFAIVQSLCAALVATKTWQM